MPDLIHCAYCSAAASTLTTDDIAELLTTARTNNVLRGLTGMLLLSDGTFFQVLEGEAATVDSVYARIERDARHLQITKVIYEPIAKRSFGAWTMGFSNLSRADLATIPGVNDFFGAGQCFADLDAGRAKKLLDAFRGGRWRKTLASAPSTAAA